MEKIININLGGRVIAIEDGAYTALKAYIESLRSYFANEEGAGEIIADIESRIAELMSERIAAGAPAINEAHVAEIIASMGRAEDFDPVEGGSADNSTMPHTHTNNKRKFARDVDDKIAGGVCSGLASYLNVDPALVRIVFALLTLGGWGSGLVLYIVLWIFVPAGPVAPFQGRRLYRNGEDKWLGGVASGLAAYFDKETWVFRLAFVAPVLLSILSGSTHLLFHSSLFFGSFFGTFLLIYIVLWVVLPVAVTDFQKMEMRGEKINISSIRDNVYADLKDRAAAFSAEVSDSASRFVSGRGRAFAQEARAAARPVASRIGEVIGGLFKAFFIFIGSIIAFGLFMALIAYFFGGFSNVVNGFILQDGTSRTLAWLTVLLLLGAPMLALLTAIVRRLLKLRAGSRYFSFGFSMLIVAGIVCACLLATSISNNFRRSETVSAEVPIAQPASGKLVLTVPGDAVEYTGNPTWMHIDARGWDVTGDVLRSARVNVFAELSPDSQYHVVVKRTSSGTTSADARSHAENIAYPVRTMIGTDSLLTLGNEYQITRQQGYRGQGVTVIVQVPVGKKLRFDESVEDKLDGFSFPRRHHQSFSYRRGRMRWQEENEYYSDNWEPDVDYVMSPAGVLTNPSDTATAAIRNNHYKDDWRKRSLQSDSLDEVIDRLQHRKDALNEEDDED